MKTICVYCSSSDRVPEVYREAARELGRLLGEAGHGLVYGGADLGLMGLIARAVKEAGGGVVGIIPEKLANLAWTGCDQLIVTKEMRERKREMESRATGFISLPGGFGTLEELLEIITLKQLGYHDKPIVILNTAGFFQDLIELFSLIYRDGFTNSEFSKLYYLANSPRDALAYLEGYHPDGPVKKWGMERLDQT